MLVAGSKVLDFHDLRETARYEGWSGDHPVIRWFWDVVFSLTPEEQREILMFTTGNVNVHPLVDCAIPI